MGYTKDKYVNQSAYSMKYRIGTSYFELVQMETSKTIYLQYKSEDLVTWNMESMCAKNHEDTPKFTIGLSKFIESDNILELTIYNRQTGGKCTVTFDDNFYIKNIERINWFVKTPMMIMNKDYYITTEYNGTRLKWEENDV